VEIPIEISSEVKKSMYFSTKSVRKARIEVVNDEIEQVFSNRHVNWGFEDVPALSARISAKRHKIKCLGRGVKRRLTKMQVLLYTPRFTKQNQIN
jgi:hypothetical protein